jgi:L,D-transpeptidase ErfK/SrfK
LAWPQSGGIGTHGTLAPTSIDRFRSHDCIRLHPDDIADPFGRVPIGTPAHITYTPVILARLTNDWIYLEVHRDVFKCAGDPLVNTAVPMMSVQRIATSEGTVPWLDWPQVEEVIRLKDGVAWEVSQRPSRAVD